MDIQRYLNDELVRACPPSAAYRFSRFARQNKGVLATAGLIAVTLVVGTAISVSQAMRATTAQGLATTNFHAAEVQRQKAQSQVQLTEQANDQALRRLYEAQLAQVKAGSLSRRSGQRLGSLETLTKATALARELKLPAENDLQLRNAAIACLSLSDMRLAKEWVGWPVGSTHSDFDENLERYARGDVHGAVSVHRVIDNVRIALLPATDPSVYSIRTPATNGLSAAWASPWGNAKRMSQAPTGNAVKDFSRNKTGLVNGITGESILRLSHECGDRL